VSLGSECRLYYCNSEVHKFCWSRI